MKKSFMLWEYLDSFYSRVNTNIIRCTLILLLVTVFQAQAETSYPNDARLNMQMRDVTVQNVLDEIENQSEFFFLFNRKLIDVNRKVDVSIENKDINETLAQVFQGMDVEYLVIDRQIVLSTSDYPLDAKTMLQPRTVSGVVSGQDGEPLIGVSISIQGTTIGTITDLNGNFTLSNVPEDATLVFSYIGMTTQEIAVGNQTTMNVTMEEDVLGLEEVVVVGYGTQKKIDLTGSISSVSPEEISVVPVTRVDQALQGRAAGVLLRQNSFDPGPGSIKITIRGLNSINGNNDPLFVIDGVIGGDINTLDPLDIESIDVLKDASAASIYGSRAANGVVLVTTKGGVAGKTRVTFDAYYGISNANRLYDVMNPQQYMEYVNDVRTQDGIALSYPDIPGVLRQVGDGTDWQKELFGTGSQQKYFLSVSGGNESITYNASGGYLYTKGLMPNVDYKKYTARFNMDFKATNYLRFFTNLSYANDVTNSMASTWDGRSGSINVIATPPMLSPTDEFGEYPPLIYNNFETGTPTYYYNTFAALDREIRESLGSYLQFNAGAEVRFTDWLNYRITLGLQPTIRESRYFRPAEIPEPQYFTLQATASKNSNRSNNWLVENMLTFEKSFNDSHNVTVLLGTSTQKNRYESTNAGSANFVFEQYQFHNLGAGVQANYSVGSSLSEQQLQSFFSRINYNYKGKYLFQLNGRYDGSSKFSPDNRWAFFPSASIGWRLSDEAFMSGMSSIDNMKLRASYGSIGSHAISPYATNALINGTFSYGFNDVRVGTYKPAGIANKNLKWETTTQLDIGLDMGLFNHRVDITLDYYHKKTTDLLLNQTITLVNNPTTNHNPSIRKNIGSLQNTGFEFNVGYRSAPSSGFNWSVDLNGTFQQNKLLDLALAEGQESLLLGDNLRRNYQMLQEGQPFGDYVGYVTDGLYQNQGEIDGSAQPASQPGDMKYVDQNNDGVINHDDFKVLGNAYPDFFGGLTANLGYKAFNLSIFFFSMLGQEVFNFELAQWKYDLSSTQFNKFAEVGTDRWTGPGTSNDIPRAGYKPVNITDGADGAIDVMVEDASFLKLRNITLSYDLPKAFLSKLSMSTANVYIQGNNLLTLTKYTGYDPEANQMGGSVITLPLNSGYYPSTRTFMIGLQIGF